jgi:CTP synthase (UTP-ammonia lyase)
VSPMRIIALGDRDPAYLTHRAIDEALDLFPADVDAGWVATDSPEARKLDAVDGVWLLPGTPYRDDAAGYAAARHCLDTGTPFLGTCGGFQYACIELARRLAGVEAAADAETDPDAAELVVQPLRCSLYGERRLVRPVPGTRLAAICGLEPFEGFHWCACGLADRFVGKLEAAGVVVSAVADEVGVEGIELPGHPFFLATAFQPQVGNGETRRVHPLLDAFMSAAISHAKARPTETTGQAAT